MGLRQAFASRAIVGQSSNRKLANLAAGDGMGERNEMMHEAFFDLVTTVNLVASHLWLLFVLR